MSSTLPKHVSRFEGRTGWRYRHRRKGQPTRYFKSDPFTPEWLSWRPSPHWGLPTLPAEWEDPTA